MNNKQIRLSRPGVHCSAAVLDQVALDEVDEFLAELVAQQIDHLLLEREEKKVKEDLRCSRSR